PDFWYWQAYQGEMNRYHRTCSSTPCQAVAATDPTYGAYLPGWPRSGSTCNGWVPAQNTAFCNSPGYGCAVDFCPEVGQGTCTVDTDCNAYGPNLYCDFDRGNVCFPNISEDYIKP